MTYQEIRKEELGKFLVERDHLKKMPESPQRNQRLVVAEKEIKDIRNEFSANKQEEDNRRKKY